MRFFLTGGYRAHDLERARVDNRDRLIKLRGHVEHAACSIVNRAMGAYAMAKINLARDLAAGDVDHHHLLPIRPWLPYAGTSINRHVSGSAVRRGGHLVARNASLGYGSQLLGRDRVDDAEVAITLVRGHQ